MSLNQLISVSQEIRTLSAAQLFYRAGSRQVLKIHSKRKFSNWHYINEAERGLPCDCEKVQRWVRNIYFGDQRSRSEAGRGVSLSYSHKWKYYFLFQINTLVRILYFRSRVQDQTALANGAFFFVCSLHIFYECHKNMSMLRFGLCLCTLRGAHFNCVTLCNTSSDKASASFGSNKNILTITEKEMNGLH